MWPPHNKQDRRRRGPRAEDTSARRYQILSSPSCTRQLATVLASGAVAACFKKQAWVPVRRRRDVKRRRCYSRSPQRELDAFCRRWSKSAGGVGVSEAALQIYSSPCGGGTRQPLPEVPCRRGRQIRSSAPDVSEPGKPAPQWRRVRGFRLACPARI
jgi:hypothetical protein